MATAAAQAAGRLRLQLPPLPFAEDALAPVISAETIQLHYGKHHRKYVDTTNQLLEKEPAQARTLEELVRSSSGKLFNNAAQAWNHDFYWHSLSPKPGKPGGAMRSQLERDFGSIEAFVDRFATAAIGQFGSGWAWLVHKDGKLEVVATPIARAIHANVATTPTLAVPMTDSPHVSWKAETDRSNDSRNDRFSSTRSARASA